MKALFYRWLLFVSSHVGHWFFRFAATAVAIGYFFFKPSARNNGIRFYRTLFPGQGRLFHYRCTLRQFVNFTDLFADRLRLADDAALVCVTEGWEHLRAALEKKTGAILLMSHLGNWEAAAHLLHRDLRGLGLLLFMGVRQKEAIEGLQKADLSQKGVRIVGVDEAGGSPFDIVEAIRFLKSGGFVSMTGDRVWRKGQRTLPGLFMGKPVRVPEAPFVLSLVSGSPVIFFFSFRTGPGKFHLKACEPLHPLCSGRAGRQEAIRQAAQSYLTELEAAARAHPFQWYHFEGFF